MGKVTGEELGRYTSPADLDASYCRHHVCYYVLARARAIAA